MTFTQRENIAASFQANTERAPHKRFLRLHSRNSVQDVTFADVLDAARSYNHAFRESGMPVRSVVAIILDHSVDLYSAFLGAIMAGHIPTIMPYLTPKQNPELYWSSHAKLFALSGIDAVVTYAANRDALVSVLGDQVRHLWVREEIDRASTCDLIDHTDIALLQHSSGTTGLKKGVMLAHGPIHTQVRNYAQSIGLDRDSKIVTWLPLYHDMGLIACFLTPMIMGCEISHLDAIEWSAKPTSLLDEIVDFGGQYVWLPNFSFNHIVNNIRPRMQWDLSSMRAFINCSEPCKASTFRRFREHPALQNLPETALQVCYAMAENVFAVTQTNMRASPRTLRIREGSLRGGERIEDAGDAGPAEGGIAELLSCGTPIEGVEVAIKPAGRERTTEDRVIGEITISGTSLYSGYYRRPDVTEKKFIGGWHLTGDIGFLADGELYVTGRVDDLLIIRGKNVYAHEIEDVVNQLGVAIPGRVVSFSVPNAMLGTDEAVVICEIREDAVQTEIRRHLREAVELETGVTVAHIRMVPHGTLVKTTSGKISREANRASFLEKANG